MTAAKRCTEALPAKWMIDSGMETDGDRVTDLIGSRCVDCGAVFFPRTPICDGCLSEDLREYRLPRAGVIYSYTVMHVGARGVSTPFGLAYVDLSDGLRVLARLAGEASDWEIDGPVSLTTVVVGTDPEGGPLLNFGFEPTGGDHD